MKKSNFIIFITVIAVIVAIAIILYVKHMTYYYWPSVIILFRHGEKTAGSNFLNEKGKKRAEALVKWIGTTAPKEFTDGVPVSATYSPLPGPFGEDSRPRQLISPATFALDLSIYGTKRYFETEESADEILGNPYLENRPVVVCWEHGCTQKLLHALLARVPGKVIFDSKTTPGYIPVWSGSDFASVVILKKNGADVTVFFGCENVLPGDAEECATYKQPGIQTCKVY